MFFVSFASKERSIQIDGLESTLASISISVVSKWVSLAVNLFPMRREYARAALGAFGRHGSLQKRWI